MLTCKSLTKVKPYKWYVFLINVVMQLLFGLQQNILEDIYMYSSRNKLYRYYTL